MIEEKEITEAAQMLANGRTFTSVKIERSFSHGGQRPSPGHVWYKYSYTVGVKKNGSRTSGAAQITLAYEKSVGEEAVKDYITQKYILKNKISE